MIVYRVYARHISNKRTNNNIHGRIFNNPFHSTPLKAATNSLIFAPQNFAFPLFPISYGYYSRPKRNQRQQLCKILGGKLTRYIMLK